MSRCEVEFLRERAMGVCGRVLGRVFGRHSGSANVSRCPPPSSSSILVSGTGRLEKRPNEEARDMGGRPGLAVPEASGA